MRKKIRPRTNQEYFQRIQQNLRPFSLKSIQNDREGKALQRPLDLLQAHSVINRSERTPTQTLKKEQNQKSRKVVQRRNPSNPQLEIKRDQKSSMEDTGAQSRSGSSSSRKCRDKDETFLLRASSRRPLDGSRKKGGVRWWGVEGEEWARKGYLCSLVPSSTFSSLIPCATVWRSESKLGKVEKGGLQLASWRSSKIVFDICD